MTFTMFGFCFKYFVDKSPAHVVYLHTMVQLPGRGGDECRPLRPPIFIDFRSIEVYKDTRIKKFKNLIH